MKTNFNTKVNHSPWFIISIQCFGLIFFTQDWIFAPDSPSQVFLQIQSWRNLQKNDVVGRENQYTRIYRSAKRPYLFIFIMLNGSTLWGMLVVSPGRLTGKWFGSNIWDSAQSSVADKSYIVLDTVFTFLFWHVYSGRSRWMARISQLKGLDYFFCSLVCRKSVKMYLAN